MLIFGMAGAAHAAPTGGANQGCGAYAPTVWVSRLPTGTPPTSRPPEPGKADAKNPPGQAPDGSDSNKGYECDENQGVGKTNPAHSGCSRTEPERTNRPRQIVPGAVLLLASDAAATSADAGEDEDRERDDGQDDENGPQHGETPSSLKVRRSREPQQVFPIRGTPKRDVGRRHTCDARYAGRRARFLIATAGRGGALRSSPWVQAQK